MQYWWGRGLFRWSLFSWLKAFYISIIGCLTIYYLINGASVSHISLPKSSHIASDICGWNFDIFIPTLCTDVILLTAGNTFRILKARIPQKRTVAKNINCRFNIIVWIFVITAVIFVIEYVVSEILLHFKAIWNSCYAWLQLIWRFFFFSQRGRKKSSQQSQVIP